MGNIRRGGEVGPEETSHSVVFLREEISLADYRLGRKTIYEMDSPKKIYKRKPSAISFCIFSLSDICGCTQPDKSYWLNSRITSEGTSFQKWL